MTTEFAEFVMQLSDEKIERLFADCVLQLILTGQCLLLLKMSNKKLLILSFKKTNF